MVLAPGAHDNASGTAGVVEAARVLSPHRFQKTMKFICFSAEEIGLQGSGAYAPEALVRGDDIAGVLNMDMIGYVDAAPEDVDLVANPASEWLLDFTGACAGAYVPDLPVKKVIDPTHLASDHASFWNSGYRALLVIEDEDITYPHYHTTNDTLGNVTMSLAAAITRMGIATLAELAIPDSVTSVSGPRSAPALLLNASPNPFRKSTAISFGLAVESRIQAGIYNVRGRLVRALADGVFPAGAHDLEWDGRDIRGRRVSPGIYFARVDAGGRIRSAKVIVLN